MCEPVSIAMTALSIGSTLMKSKAANATADAQNQAAQAQYTDNMAALQEQQQQINQSATDQQSVRAIEAMKERGRLNATSGEMGVTGNSVDKALQESLFNEGTDISMIESNRKNGVVQNTRSMSGAGVQLAGNINQANSGRISGLATAIDVGTAVGAGYNMAQTRAANKIKIATPTR